MQVYLDNAATTSLDEQVLEAMLPFMKDQYGNPSSIHSHGRKVRSAIEQSRKQIADLFNTSPSEIFFTSGGTEADNTALTQSITTGGIRSVLTSKLEHHAVLHTLEQWHKRRLIELDFVGHDEKGNINLDELGEWVKTHPGSLVSLMHANNEIGNILDLKAVAEACKEHKVVLHSDTVQTVGHYDIDLQEIPVHCIAGAAHKFHGPKGVGFMYINHEHSIDPYIHGGSQERNMRGGTENVYGIVGLSKALEVAYNNLADQRAHIEGLKQRMIDQLAEKIPGVAFNGESADLNKSLYTVLNVSLPPADDNEMLLFSLDIHKISASGGSACSSGSSVGSHVLAALDHDPRRGAIRFSFSKHNTAEEIDYTVEKLVQITQG
ncbi:MAG: cysteine desulfurase family protein [Bacteroidota bacterium]